MRNFNLYRLESTYEIRGDISSTVHAIKPRLAHSGETTFTGYARMAIPLYSFSVTQVRKPRVGESKPALVRAEIQVDLSPFNRSAVRQEWEQLREHDVLFLLTVRATPEMAAKAANAQKRRQQGQHGQKGKGPGQKEDWDKVTMESLGIVSVRGCELVRVLDEDKKVVGEMDENGNAHVARGNMRFYQVDLDSAQYQDDMAKVVNDDQEDVYTTFNLLLRRKPKENNFRAVLSTIRDLMESDCLIPEWLHDVFLGYGDPHAAQYYRLPQQLTSISFRDTFQDEQHMRDALPEQVEIKGQAEGAPARDPSDHTFYEVQFPMGKEPDHAAIQTLKPFAEREASAAPVTAAAKPKPKAKAKASKGKKAAAAAVAEEAAAPAVVQARPYSRPKVWGETTIRRNLVRFTPMQVEAIKSGMNPGLTMVVGPPGTGKTDTAVQIISEMYHNFPDQRILLVTHSNNALNDLFEKLLERDIDERYLLRLGRGQDFLQSDKDFSKFGRVNHMLNRRLALLDEVQALGDAMGLQDDVGSTVETAGHFYSYQVTARWEEFQQKLKSAPADGEFGQLFPFTQFFHDLKPEEALFEEGGQGLGAHRAANWAVAESCWRYLEKKFTELLETKPFEQLRTGRDRGTHLLTKHAKVIAMTCTHAGINRPNFLKWGFQFDNIIMEEAAQILEIETFIPMMLQRDDKEFGNRLKRVVLLGDHHQLPPVIKNRAFQKFCHMDQSLFTRFVRLGMPYIQLNAQGRMRPSLAELWNWKYNNLQDLPNVTTPKFLRANAGLAHEFQLIDVPDYQGQGESSPQPYFYQNLGEAEYVVHMFMYMRLIGYPADKISIITTYNGQKSLIRDVVAVRCASDPLYGEPHKITTVDKFQGQQNDIVLLSLVKTRSAGHIRDIRRLVVAMSRARLGLYVFCRKELFLNCYELTRTFNVLLKRPTQLQVLPKERTRDGLHETRLATAEAPTKQSVQGVEQMMTVVAELRVAIQSEWEVYQQRLEEYQTKLAKDKAVVEQRKAEAEEARRAAAAEEAKSAAEAKKAEAYAKQTEEFMEKTYERVEQAEKEAIASTQMTDDGDVDD